MASTETRALKRVSENLHVHEWGARIERRHERAGLMDGGAYWSIRVTKASNSPPRTESNAAAVPMSRERVMPATYT
jgi:hypothetical protein